MKIITDSCIYVQKSDIDVLKKGFIPIPLSMYLKYFKDNDINTESDNKYEFIKFDCEEEIEFFKKLNWIIDYDQVKHLSVDELMELGKTLSHESSELAHLYESMNDKEKLDNRSLFIKHELLEHKIHSIEEILWIKFKLIRINMPEHIDGLDNKVNYIEETVVKKLIKRFTKHN